MSKDNSCKNHLQYLSLGTEVIGSALFRAFQAQGYTNIITRTHSELDLQNQASVEDLFSKEKQEYVFLSAAKVGGIYANNTYPAEFAYSNMMIQCNVVNSSYKHNVKKLLFLGSSCIYPKFAPQPMNEVSLLTGPLEETNKAYALASPILMICFSGNCDFSFSPK